jgi:hypothetical protein
MGHRDFARELSRREQIETTGTTSEYIAKLSSFVMLKLMRPQDPREIFRLQN